MATKVLNGIAHEAIEVLEKKLQIPLLEDEPAPEKPKKTPVQKALKKTCRGTANLANLLPTGTVLTFQILSPVMTNQGNCHSRANQYITLGVLGLCCIASFLLCFTDSVRDAKGKVRHGVVTFKGLWVVDSTITLSPEESAKYRLRFVDFVHAFISFFVFGAVGLFDQNVVNCLYPTPSEEVQALLSALPVVVSVICSAVSVLFPTTRHGIGFPLSRNY